MDEEAAPGAGGEPGEGALSEREGIWLLVCGGRSYSDVYAVNRYLDWVHGERNITLLIHGGASGADTLAAGWAEAKGIQQANFHIHSSVWSHVGKPAGPRRNRMMLALNPSGVLAFPGNAGTADMCAAAEEAGVPVYRVEKVRG